MAQYRILGCPFCGAAPVAFASGDGRRGLMIECATDGCVNPHTSYYDREAAVRAWNRRVGVAGARVVDDSEINETSPL